MIYFSCEDEIPSRPPPPPPRPQRQHRLQDLDGHHGGAQETAQAKAHSPGLGWMLLPMDL